MHRAEPSLLVAVFLSPPSLPFSFAGINFNDTITTLQPWISSPCISPAGIAVQKVET